MEYSRIAIKLKDDNDNEVSIFFYSKLEKDPLTNFESMPPEVKKAVEILTNSNKMVSYNAKTISESVYNVAISFT